MEANKATIKRETTNIYLVLEFSGQELQITLTDDNPNGVKGVFNSLLQELRKGPLQFQLEDDAEDLFSHICKEYIFQLNAELTAVYKEIEFYDLLEQSADSNSATE
jgi:hypothetical protein